MLIHLPLPLALSVLRPFGSDPELFAPTRFQGQPVRGHTGIDLSAPPNTPVLAAAGGLVLRARFDGDNTGILGFGGFVLLRHAWGQTLYARLQEIKVKEGDQVSAGAILGTVATANHALGSHLHFGMRIVPYSLTDGWAGYIDPQPYLARITARLDPIIGPHIIATIRPHLPTLARWQPRMILVLDPNPDEARELRQVCPNAIIIARLYHPEHETEQRIRANPQRAAQWAHEKIMARWSPHVDYWQFSNEILQDRAGLPRLNEFELARMQIAESHGYKCAILAFSVGNPDLPQADRMAHWRLVYPALEWAERHGHIVAVHQYGMPTLWGPDNAYDWYIHRLEHQVLRRLPYKKLQFAVTEFGIDGLIRGSNPAGWQSFSSAENYAAQLIKAGRYLERYCGRVLGYSIFTLGHYPPWGTYDIAGPTAELLADGLERGVWADVNIQVADIAARESDFTGEPGPEALPPLPAGPAGEPEDEPGPDEEDTDKEDPDEEDKDDDDTDDETHDNDSDKNKPPAPEKVARRIVPEFDAFNYRIAPLEERPDLAHSGSAGSTTPREDTVYIVKDIFFTQHGNWDSDAQLPVPDWAQSAYRTDSFIEAGANHHLFAAVLDAEGNLLPNVPIRFWSDGFQRLSDPNYTAYTEAHTKAESGWANLPLGTGSIFIPGRGESGPWCYAPHGAAEVICGGGLPDSQPISTFVVWQAMPRTEWEHEPDAEDLSEDHSEDQGEGTPDHEPEDEPEDIGPQPGPGKPKIELERRLSRWVAHYNLGYTEMIQPVATAGSEDPNALVFLVKDIFTTRNGSWEPDDQPGSIPDWARAAYLRPLGAPDYFDDAGGDHHLFAAVIGLDGKLIRNQPIVYWSDGLEAAQEPTYTGYIHRETKERSGWANIVIGPGSNFVPERGESGPWCWAPRGAAEIVWGGGLPANHHISSFVVWQAVRRADLFPVTDESEGKNSGGKAPDTEDPGDTDQEDNNPDRDYSIYIPVVIR